MTFGLYPSGYNEYQLLAFFERENRQLSGDEPTAPASLTDTFQQIMTLLDQLNLPNKYMYIATPLLGLIKSSFTTYSLAASFKEHVHLLQIV